MGDRYVMVGGMREGFQLLESCTAFDFISRTFGDFVCPDRPRLSPRLVSLGDRLYLAGGSSRPAPESDLEPNRALEVYDPDRGRWSVLVDELPIEPKHMQMLAYRDRLLLWSTHNEAGELHLVVIDPG